MPRSDADDGYPEEWAPYVGACTVLPNELPARWKWVAPVREFAPGFHGAAPGPSHPEPAPKPPAKPAARKPAPKRSAR